MTFFKAPVNKEDDPCFHIWYIALVNLGLDPLYNDAVSGVCLYSFYEDGKFVKMVSSAVDGYGVTKLYDPEA